MIRAVRSDKEELWRSRLQRFQSSGMTVCQFCQREQISAPSFYQWRKRLATSSGKASPPTFVPLRLTQLASPVEIQLPKGTRVCVPAGNAEALRVAVEAAGRLPGGEQQEATTC
jgi:transposase-like protein